MDAPRPLTPAQRSHQRTLLSNWFGNRAATALGRTVELECVDPATLTEDDVLDCLTQGVTFRADCTPWTPHPIRVCPEGTLTLVNHDDHVVDLDVELVMEQLAGGAAPGCLGIAVGALTRRRHAAPLSTLRAMVSWAPAQHRLVGRDEWKKFANKAVTRWDLDRYTADGWDADTAYQFLSRGIPDDLANQWRRAGDTTARAAAMAARGATPDQNTAWQTAGFTITQAAKWRQAGVSLEAALVYADSAVTPAHAARHEKRLVNVTDRDLARREVRALYDLPGLTAAQAEKWARCLRSGLPASATDPQRAGAFSRDEAERVAPHAPRRASTAAQWCVDITGAGASREEALSWLTEWGGERIYWLAMAIPLGSPALLRMLRETSPADLDAACALIRTSPAHQAVFEALLDDAGASVFVKSALPTSRGSGDWSSFGECNWFLVSPNMVVCQIVLDIWRASTRMDALACSTG